MIKENPIELLEQEQLEWKHILQKRTLEHNQMLQDLAELNERIKRCTDNIEAYDKAIRKLKND